MVENPKPHPEVYNKGFKTLRLPESARQHVLAVEDDQRGILSAHNAGLITCAITTRFPRDYFIKQATPPDLIVDSYPELEVVIGLT